MFARNFWLKPQCHFQQPWQKVPFAQDYVGMLIHVTDFDNDGPPEIIFRKEIPNIMEGTIRTRCLIRTGFGLISLGKRTILAKDFVDPHSLIVADFNHNGPLDICVIEMDFTENLQVILCVNKGNGFFETHGVVEGTGSTILSSSTSMKNRQS